MSGNTGIPNTANYKGGRGIHRISVGNQFDFDRNAASPIQKVFMGPINGDSVEDYRDSHSTSAPPHIPAGLIQQQKSKIYHASHPLLWETSS